ncbi:MAG: hypothetical protein ACRC2Y_04485 [Aeromonas veronii]
MTLEEPELIAVPAPSFWLSQANTEFNQNGWASNITRAAGLGAGNVWLSNLAGKANASHQMLVGVDQYKRYGFYAATGLGSLSPSNIDGFPILELYYNSHQWVFTLGGSVSDERIWVEVPNVVSVLFEFEYSSSGWAIGGDVHGLGKYIQDRAGQTVGINIYRT